MMSSITLQYSRKNGVRVAKPSKIYIKEVKKKCAGGGSRTHTGRGLQVFETCASAIPPLRQYILNYFMFPIRSVRKFFFLIPKLYYTA